MWERLSRLTVSKIGTYPNDSKYALEWAESRRLIVVPAEEGVLQLDIDTPQQLLKCHIALHAVDKVLGVADVKWTTSPSGNGWHIYVEVDPEKAAREGIRQLGSSYGYFGLPSGWDIEDWQIWACQMQALLGSDPVREANGLIRVYNDDRMPTLLFEKDGAKPRPYKSLYDKTIRAMEDQWLNDKVFRNARIEDSVIHRDSDRK